MKSEVLVARGLSKSFWQGDREVVVLAGLDLTVYVGETVAIVGVSGSGKSTLLHLLAGLDQPDGGTIIVAGTDLTALDAGALGQLRNQHLGFVYQFHHLLPEFTAVENIAMPLMIGGMDRQAAETEATLMLEKVGLAARASHRPAALSGGERQRVAIARALVTRPDLVLADEPTGNLDEDSAARIHELMIELSEEFATAFVVVTHNLSLAQQMQRVLRLHGGHLHHEFE